MNMLRASTLILALLSLMLPAGSPCAQAPETVCIQCHGSLQDKLGAPVGLWRTSIHAENDISCNGCHGGDPKDAAYAMSPARGFIGVPSEVDTPGFCGRCHPGVLKDYLSSAHGKALGNGGPTCVTCHGNHDIVKATLSLINEKSCTRCHSFERARIIRDAMQGTEASIQGIGERIGGFQATGVDTERLAKGLFAVRNSFHSLFHEVNVTRVKSESSRINAELAKLDKDLRAIEDARERRKVAGAIVVAGLLAAAFLAHLLRKSFEKR